MPGVYRGARHRARSARGVAVAWAAGRSEAPVASAAGASRLRVPDGVGYLSVATSSATALTDLSIMACSSALSFSSRMRSAPPAPITTGTPT